MKHRHRYVKAPVWWLCGVSLPGDRTCPATATVMCWDRCGGWCAFHDPRRKPTPAEREERRELLRAANGRHDGCRPDYSADSDCTRCESMDAVLACYEQLDHILESAAWAWSDGPRR